MFSLLSPTYRVPLLLCLRKPFVRPLGLLLLVCCVLWSLLYHYQPLAGYPPPPHRHHPSYGFRGNFHQSDSLWSYRAEEVRKAFLHAYRGYTEFAGGHDELLPITRGYSDDFNGWSLSLIDALDTMWIMGLDSEFQDSLAIVANLNFTQEEGTYAPFFETVIRYLGGLLSAHALSGEGILLRKADELGSMLLLAFNTTSGLPMYSVNTGNGETRVGWNPGVLLSEALSCQMEYKYLAYLTGRTQYYDKVENVMSLMHNMQGLLPTLWDFNKGTPLNEHYSVGAYADSAYEYLLKQYLLTDRTDSNARDLYLRTATAIIHNLLYVSPTRKLLYVTDVDSGAVSHIFEHLSCFLPGLFALGVHTLAPDELSPEQRRLHSWAAEGLANTCWMTYSDSTTGLGPDEVLFLSQSKDGVPSMKWVDALQVWEDGGGVGPPPGVGDGQRVRNTKSRDYSHKTNKYMLRPEAIETFYIMWRTTGDDKWRERGWAVFLSIEREARTRAGYATVLSVDDSPTKLRNEMPSFFMAETLKYLYLLFTDEDIIPLDRWVFNTEAHPLPVFTWPKWQKEAQHIP